MAGLVDCSFLLVEGNAHMREIVETILRGFGGRMIMKVDNGADALALLQSRPFDVVFTDYVLPGIDGVALAHAIRRSNNSPNRYSAFIMLTSYTSRPRVEAARDAGFNEICIKPVVPRDLFRRLTAVADAPRPFIQSNAYAGPDRRRHRSNDYTGVERRQRIGDAISKPEFASH